MSTEIDNILYQHREAVVKGLYSIKLNRLEQAAKVICKAIKERRDIYTIGNGASASIAQHWACDYTKGSSQLDPENEQFLKVRVHSLASNIPLMTAISNDISYDEVYAYQLERLGAAHPRA